MIPYLAFLPTTMYVRRKLLTLIPLELNEVVYNQYALHPTLKTFEICYNIKDSRFRFDNYKHLSCYASVWEVDTSRIL